MIGVFDSGHGGLTVLAALAARFPERGFVYMGDHGNAPYGDRPHGEIVALTRAGCGALFARGCKMVVLACNTATAIALRTLQQEWLPAAWPDRKILGIIAPTVEVVTQTPWHEKEPVFPQKYNRDVVALFGTTATVGSGVYEAEIAKRCPHVTLVGQACPALVPLIEGGAPTKAAVQACVEALLAKAPRTPDWAILGCTHYPLIEADFRAFLPPQVRILSQPDVMADALEDYLARHPTLVGAGTGVTLLTTGDVGRVNDVAGAMGFGGRFEAL